MVRDRVPQAREDDCFQAKEARDAYLAWAHARRTIYDVAKENPHRVKLLEMFEGLYDVNACEQGMGTEARLEHRQKHALPILEVIKKYVDSLTNADVLPKSDLAGAVGYLRNHWDHRPTRASASSPA